GRGGWKYAWYLLRRNPLTLAGAALVLAVVGVAVLAPTLAPYPPDKVDFASRLLAPGPEHWFGTDELGRDIFSRVIWGSRASVGAGFFIVAVALSAGLVVGSISGYFGGRLDTVIMRLMDIVLGFPSLILAMALAAALGPNLTNAMLAVAFVRIPVYVRLVRGQSLQVREREFVKGARCFG
ncbi:MAG: ABC transporter permease subunit, partial [Bacillota bacterium]|nr:ABC transporter permease subunit [Bacillota bacterium]